MHPDASRSTNPNPPLGLCRGARSDNPKDATTLDTGYSNGDTRVPEVSEAPRTPVPDGSGPRDLTGLRIVQASVVTTADPPAHRNTNHPARLADVVMSPDSWTASPGRRIDEKP